MASYNEIGGLVKRHSGGVWQLARLVILGWSGEEIRMVIVGLVREGAGLRVVVCEGVGEGGGCWCPGWPHQLMPGLHTLPTVLLSTHRQTQV